VVPVLIAVAMAFAGTLKRVGGVPRIAVRAPICAATVNVVQQNLVRPATTIAATVRQLAAMASVTIPRAVLLVCPIAVCAPGAAMVIAVLTKLAWIARTIAAGVPTCAVMGSVVSPSRAAVANSTVILAPAAAVTPTAIQQNPASAARPIVVLVRMCVAMAAVASLRPA